MVTGVGVVSPYGIGLDCLQAGMLSGKCCLAPTKDVYRGFEGTTAQVSVLPLPANGDSSRYSRSDRMAMVAARDAVTNFDGESVGFRESGVFMASTVAGLSEIDPGIAAVRWFRGLRFQRDGDRARCQYAARRSGAHDVGGRQ